MCGHVVRCSKGGGGALQGAGTENSCGLCWQSLPAAAQCCRAGCAPHPCSPHSTLQLHVTPTRGSPPGCGHGVHRALGGGVACEHVRSWNGGVQTAPISCSMRPWGGACPPHLLIMWYPAAPPPPSTEESDCQMWPRGVLAMAATGHHAGSLH